MKHMSETAVSRILAALDGWLATEQRGELRCADGVASPVTNATVTGHARAVLTIHSINTQSIPRGHTVDEVAIAAGGGVFVTARAWNRPTFHHSYRFLTIEWKRDVIRYYLREHLRAHHPDGPQWLHFLPSAPQPATRALVQALEDLARRGATPAIAPALLALVHQARWELAQPHDAYDDPATMRWIRLRDWLDEHLADPVDRTAAGKACGVHPSSVSRLVTRQTGESFVAYVTRRRLEQACTLLTRYEMPIATVAAACGFGSGEYFANVFRRRHGVAPSAWARRHWEA